MIMDEKKLDVPKVEIPVDTLMALNKIQVKYEAIRAAIVSNMVYAPVKEEIKMSDSTIVLNAFKILEPNTYKIAAEMAKSNYEEAIERAKQRRDNEHSSTDRQTDQEPDS